MTSPTDVAAQLPDLGFDPTVPSAARIYDYLLGGKDNFAADREAAQKILAGTPEFRTSAVENRAFLGRAVRYLAHEQKIMQFLDIGTGIPTAANTHEVAQAIEPASRVVYTDSDPMVLAHAKALLTSTPQGATSYIEADLRDPGKILELAARRLDLSRPVALLLVAIMHFIPDEDDPAGIIAAYRDALAPGSYLVLSHGTGDFHPAAVTDRAAAVYSAGPARLALRTRVEVQGLCDGFDLVDPGVVQAPRWRPERESTLTEAELGKIGVYAAVGRRH